MHLTVGIATWNRSPLLRRTLDALAQQQVGGDIRWRVLVCDNNSTDDTKAVVEQMVDRLPLLYLFESTQGKSHALNRLLREAEGDWLILIDDDVRTRPGWLHAYVAGIGRHPEAACLGGPILPWVEGDLRGRRAFLLEHYPAAYGVLRLEKDTAMTLPDLTAYGGNMALRQRDVPEGGFDPNRGMIGNRRVYGEDVDLLRDLLESDHRGFLLADAAVEHYLPPQRLGVSAYLRWQMGFGRYWVVERGAPEPGRFGVPWWAWREMVTRALAACVRWRPWPTLAYYRALGEAAKYYGYLTAK